MEIIPQELRIGNLILNKPHGVEPMFAYQILQLYNDYRDGATSDYYKEFEPIPVTEEWLLKLGFERRIDGYAIELPFDENLHSDRYSLYRSYDSERMFTCGTRVNEGHGGIIVKYVHQLQNLYFALTNKELVTS